MELDGKTRASYFKQAFSFKKKKELERDEIGFHERLRRSKLMRQNGVNFFWAAPNHLVKKKTPKPKVSAFFDPNAN